MEYHIAINYIIKETKTIEAKNMGQAMEKLFSEKGGEYNIDYKETRRLNGLDDNSERIAEIIGKYE